MVDKISKIDKKDIIEQSKEIIKFYEAEIKVAKEVIRKGTINITTATAIIKYLK